MAGYFERTHELGKEGLPGDGAVHKILSREEAKRYVAELHDEEVILLDALLSYLGQRHPQAQILLETSGKVEL